MWQFKGFQGCKFFNFLSVWLWLICAFAKQYSQLPFIQRGLNILLKVNLYIWEYQVCVVECRLFPVAVCLVSVLPVWSSMKPRGTSPLWESPGVEDTCWHTGYDQGPCIQYWIKFKLSFDIHLFVRSMHI